LRDDAGTELPIRLCREKRVLLSRSGRNAVQTGTKLARLKLKNLPFPRPVELGRVCSASPAPRERAAKTSQVGQLQVENQQRVAVSLHCAADLSPLIEVVPRDRPGLEVLGPDTAVVSQPEVMHAPWFRHSWPGCAQFAVAGAALELESVAEKW
jgi:hypothetical protein